MKLKKRLGTQFYLEVLIMISILASLFFEYDFGFMGYINILFIRPVLILLMILSIGLRVVLFIKREMRLVRQNVGFLIYLGLLLLSLFYILTFQREIALAREIIYFDWNKENFREIVSLSLPILRCPKPSEFGCRENVRLPNQLWADEQNILAITYEETVALLLRHRTYVHYLYVEGQTGIPQLSLGDFKISCFYRLTEDWYIC